MRKDKWKKLLCIEISQRYTILKSGDVIASSCFPGLGYDEYENGNCIIEQLLAMTKNLA